MTPLSAKWITPAVVKLRDGPADGLYREPKIVSHICPAHGYRELGRTVASVFGTRTQPEQKRR